MMTSHRHRFFTTVTVNWCKCHVLDFNIKIYYHYNSKTVTISFFSVLFMFAKSQIINRRTLFNSTYASFSLQYCYRWRCLGRNTGRRTVLEMKIWIYWSESNSWTYFYIHVVLNKNWKIYKVLLVFVRRTSAHREDCMYITIIR